MSPISSSSVVSEPSEPSGSLPTQTLYTAFTPRQKHYLTFLLGIITLVSTLTATIYLPLLPLLQTLFHTSAQAINLTITVYIIFQAISPAIFATLSDSFGRRPIYLTTYTLYTLSSLGLALNKNSYAALLVLRALQSLGASAVLSVAYGVVADVCVPAERGKMLGFVMAAANLGVCVGPVVGGWVALWSKGFEWVFWCLVIFGGAVLGTIGWTLPETARNVVGNGSVQATGWGRTWWSVLRLCWGKRRMRVGQVEDAHSGGDGQRDSDSERKRKIKISNPLSCLRILFWKDTSLVLWMSASFYAVYYCIQASIPSTYKQIYHFNELEIGLAYLTGGAGVMLGGYTNGKMMDSNYKITAKKIGHTVDKVSGDDLKHFPIERARARGSWYLLIISTCTLIGYGWALEKHAHESISLILQFLLGFLCTCFNQTFSALLVDMFPASPSTAAASGNIVRCALSALAVAVMQPLLDGMGRGWFFTFLGILSGVVGVAAVWAIQAWGMKWRGRRISDGAKPRGEDVSGETGFNEVNRKGENDEKPTPSAPEAGLAAGDDKGAADT